MNTRSLAFFYLKGDYYNMVTVNSNPELVDFIVGYVNVKHDYFYNEMLPGVINYVNGLLPIIYKERFNTDEQFSINVVDNKLVVYRDNILLSDDMAAFLPEDIFDALFAESVVFQFSETGYELECVGHNYTPDFWEKVLAGLLEFCYSFA